MGYKAPQAELSEGVTCLGSGSGPQLSWPTNVCLSPYLEGFWDLIITRSQGSMRAKQVPKRPGFSFTMSTRAIAQARGLGCSGLVPIRKNENLWGRQTSQHVIVSRWSRVTVGNFVTKHCSLCFSSCCLPSGAIRLGKITSLCTASWVKLEHSAGPLVV